MRPPTNDELPLRPRVLIVDDEPGVRNLLFDVLAGDCECERATNGAEALRLAADYEYDVVLCDVTMPDVSGIQILESIRDRSKTTSVIMVTAIQHTRRAVEAMRLGAFDYVLKPFDIEEVALAVRRGFEHKKLLEVSRSYRATLGTLTAALETRSVDEDGHTERVTAYTLRLARELKVPAGALDALENGALLHDIGMICVAESTLRSPGGLEPDEVVALRRHPEYGARLLRRIGFLMDAIPVVEQHHERWDGTGYPNGLAGDAIHLHARIFAVADCVDAMTSARPYRTPRSDDAVAEELRRCAGVQFDPKVVEAFLRVPSDEWARLVGTPAAQGMRPPLVEAERTTEYTE